MTVPIRRPKRQHGGQQVPIPGDWDGESWMCVKVMWPMSSGWASVLAGLLTSPIQGRFWNGQTGSVTEAQAIGWEIYDENIPLVSCFENEGPGGNGEAKAGSPCGDCGYNEEGSEDMGNCPSPPIKIEGGKLYWWQCCEWQEIGTLPGTSVGVDDPGLPPLPEGDLYPCGKAIALVQALFVLLQAVWDNKDGVLYFANVGAVDAALPAWDVDNLGILSLLNGARALDDVYTEAEVFDVNKQQSVICYASTVFDNTEVVTSSQLEAVKTSIAAIYDGNLAPWVQAGMAAIGNNNMAEIALTGAGDSTGDCSCPDPVVPTGDPTENLGYAWSYFYDFEVLDPATPIQGYVASGQWDDGIGLRDVTAANGFHDINFRMAVDNCDPTTVIDYVWVKYRTKAGFVYTVNVIGTDDETYTGGATWTDRKADDTAFGGEWVEQLSGINLPCTNRQWVQWNVKGYSPDDGTRGTIEGSNTILAVAIAGTGVDPFSG